MTGTDTMSRRVKIGIGGRLVIPSEFRESLGVRPGDEVVLSLDDRGIRIETWTESLRRAHELLAPYIDPSCSIVDELIADRRAEAARD